MKVRLTLKVLTASLFLASCAQTTTKQGTLDIEPFQEVKHGYPQAKAQYELGRYYQGQRRYRQAIAAYRQALAADPGMVDALNAMGAAYAESGDLVLAREQFERALKIRPGSAYTYNNLGFVNYLAGDYLAAVAAYKQALKFDARNEKARENLMLAYGRMGEGDQVARTAVEPPVVAAQTATQDAPQATAENASQAPQNTWVQVSPSIYEMRSAMAQPAAAPSSAVAEAAVAAQAEKAEADNPARSVMAERAIQRSKAGRAGAPVAAASTDPLAGAEPRVTRVAIKVAASPAAVSAPAAPLAALSHGVEVSNGNGIRGFAARVARYFSSKGIQQARLTNQRPFAERHTRIEYRPGSAAEAAMVNRLLPGAVPMVPSSSLRSHVRVRLVLGHDVRGNMAAWSPSTKGATLADANDSAARL